MRHKIDWTCINPRKGIAGSWDRLMGPGATALEQIIVLAPALATTAGILLYAMYSGMNWGAAKYIFAGLLVFDVAGGVIANATQSAKRWYHRPQSSKWDHIGFAALHLLHIVAFSWLFLGFDLIFIGVSWGYLLMASLAIVAAPLYLQRPVAMALTLIAAVGASLINPGNWAVQWFVPILFIKLLVSHLVTEEPYAREQETAD